MSLDEVRGSLLALLGDVPVGGTFAGWQLVHVDTDESLALVFERSGERVEIALSPRDGSIPHYAQTESFNLSYSASRLPGTPLGDGGRALVGEVAERVRANDDGAAKRRFLNVVAGDRKGEVRTIRVSSLLCPTTIGDQSYYTANPYVGCLIGCTFCYAQPRVAVIRRMAGFPEMEWGRYVTVKENAAEVLREEIARLPQLPVVFSPLVADVYQPVERTLGLTRRCLEVLADAEVPAYVLTRAALVVRDIDVFQRIPRATVGFSIPTDQDDVGLAYEPRAALISERFRALGELRRAGIRTVAVLQPLLHLDVERLVERLVDVCDVIRVDVYRPPALGGAPLVSRDPSVPPPPTDQEAVRRRIVEAAERRGLAIWTTHVPV